MKKLLLSFLLFSTTAFSSLYAQDTLPRFTLKNAGNNRIIIGWVNNYPNIKQIGIQRSFDSLSLYKTILTVPDPTAIQNGFMDVKATNDHMFYRLFILLDKGVYLFSAAKKPVLDTARKIAGAGKPDTIIVNGKMVIIPARPTIIKIDNLQWGDSSATPNPNYTKPQTTAFTPSLHVFTSRDGYVRINLPDDEKSKKYSIKFFEETGVFLFELKEIKEKDFKIDKTNFYHAGWFRFELYENGKLLEKHKFYLEKDF
ncbi:MAG TPA: hypothetical protein VK483_03475 [Chitinophagaceae bacterium]|nr:hypothetical protein [Chitinophagaceae bacterium]